MNSPGFESTAAISGEEQALSAAASAHQLGDGEVVAGRYRVIRYIARGGMGEVYEAEDLELGERVALKTIRGETRDHIAEERFKREIQLSRKVTHPNVCRIFDVGYHVRDDKKRVVFLTMELLPGQTLLERIREQGPLPIGEASAVVRQIAAGLSSAHSVGVVHRDLKSGNVILVPRKGGGVRAVVTDFGLAHVLGGAEDSARSLSGSGGIVGTPGYMAPEQVEGAALSGRTDVYALGVVMYEILTGKLPFDGTTPLSIAAKRLTTPAPSPKALRPDLPPRWEKAILACLERDPQARPATPRAVAELVGLVSDSLEEIDGTIQILKEVRRRPLWHRVVMLAACLIAVASIATIIRFRAAPVQNSVRRAIAAVPFHPADDSTSDQLWIGAFAAELVAVRLGEGQGLQAFDTAAVVSSLRDIGVTEGSELSPAELDRLRALMTLDQVVTGRYRMRSDGVLVVEAELRDARDRKILARAQEEGPSAEVAAVLGRVADKMARAAGVSSNEAGRGVGMTLPRQPSALRAFIEARERFDRREIAEASAIAARGLSEEPEHARLHLLLAEIKAEAGDDRGAGTEARAAAHLAGTLPRLERLFVEAVSSALLHDRGGAINRFEQLRAQIPGDIEIGWRLVQQLDAAGRSTDALRIVEQLRRDSVPRILGVLIDMLEVDARIALGDLDRALVAARRGAATADEVGARQLRASARYKECTVLDSLHRYEEARVACLDVKRTAAEAGNRRQRAYAVNLIANLDFSLNKLDDARRAYEEVLPIFRDLGDRSGESMVLNNLGKIQAAELDRDGAAKLWLASVAIADEFQDALSSAPTRENLSSYYAEQLDWSRAISYAQDAQRAWRSTDEPLFLVEATCRVAQLYLDVGRGQDAERQLDELEALKARLSTSSPPRADCDFLRADFEAGRGHLDRAVTILRATLQRIRALQDSEGVMAGYLLARATAATGERAAALQVLAELDDRPGIKSDVPTLRMAQMLRLRLELERGDADRAAVRFAALENELKQEKGQRALLQGSLELERARARLGDRSTALRKLKTLSETALRGGFVSLAIESQLIEAELRVEGGGTVSSAEVAELARRAQVAGRTGWSDRMERLLDAKRR